MTEDDTFRLLKRTSFEELLERLSSRPSHYWTLTPPDKSRWKQRHFDQVYKDCGWTEKEAFEEQSRRHKKNIIWTKKKHLED